MRKVKYTKWIPFQYKDADGNIQKHRTKGSEQVEGTGCYSEELDGYFHQWGQLNGGDGVETYAIVERPDGGVDFVNPGRLRFVDPLHDSLFGK